MVHFYAQFQPNERFLTFNSLNSLTHLPHPLTIILILLFCPHNFDTDQCFKHNFFKVTYIGNEGSKQQPPLWPHLLVTFTKEIENAMLWLANWNWSRRNVVVNISYQKIKQQQNIWKTFWKRFKMSRKRRIRFGNLKHAAKVEKENSCSLWTTNSLTHLLKCETRRFV